MKTILLLMLIVMAGLAASGSILGQRLPPPERLPPFITDMRSQDVRVTSFNVEKYYYSYARGANPSQTARIIRLIGHTGNLEYYAYLTFSDDEAQRPPRFEESNYTVYIYYPESFFSEIEDVLTTPGRAVCQIYFVDKNTIWASVESPIIERTGTPRP
jgi:hypothetical protein